MMVHIFTGSGWVDKPVYVMNRNTWSPVIVHSMEPGGWDDAGVRCKYITTDSKEFKDKDGYTYLCIAKE